MGMLADAGVPPACSTHAPMEFQSTVKLACVKQLQGLHVVQNSNLSTLM